MKQYERKKIFSFLTCLLLLVLEMLPFGAVMNFAKAPEAGGGVTKEYYSYFSLLPFGYANFGPLLSAILSVLLLFFLILSLIFDRKILLKLSFAVSGLAFVTSLMPLLLGFHYFSFFGGMISLLLLLEICLLFQMIKE